MRAGGGRQSCDTAPDRRRLKPWKGLELAWRSEAQDVVRELGTRSGCAGGWLRNEVTYKRLDPGAPGLCPSTTALNGLSAILGSWEEAQAESQLVQAPRGEGGWLS